MYSSHTLTYVLSLMYVDFICRGAPTPVARFFFAMATVLPSPLQSPRGSKFCGVSSLERAPPPRAGLVYVHHFGAAQPLLSTITNYAQDAKPQELADEFYDTPSFKL